MDRCLQEQYLFQMQNQLPRAYQVAQAAPVVAQTYPFGASSGIIAAPAAPLQFQYTTAASHPFQLPLHVPAYPEPTEPIIGAPQKMEHLASTLEQTQPQHFLGSNFYYDKLRSADSTFPSTQLHQCHSAHGRQDSGFFSIGTASPAHEKSFSACSTQSVCSSEITSTTAIMTPASADGQDLTDHDADASKSNFTNCSRHTHMSSSTTFTPQSSFVSLTPAASTEKAKVEVIRDESRTSHCTANLSSRTGGVLSDITETTLGASSHSSSISTDSSASTTTVNSSVIAAAAAASPLQSETSRLTDQSRVSDAFSKLRSEGYSSSSSASNRQSAHPMPPMSSPSKIKHTTSRRPTKRARPYSKLRYLPHVPNGVRHTRNDKLLTEKHVLNKQLDLESDYVPTTDYMQTVQTDITPAMRAMVVEWLFEVAAEEHREPDVCLLALNYLDRFLSKKDINRRHVQLCASACMFMASKFREAVPLTAEKMVLYTDYSITKQDLIDKELIILHALQWDLCAPTPASFVHLILRRLFVDAENLSDLSREAYRLLTFAYRDLGLMRYSPSVLASAVIYLAARECYGVDWVTQTNLMGRLVPHVRVKQVEVEECTETVFSVVAKFSTSLQSQSKEANAAPEEEDEKLTPVDVREVQI